METNKLLKFSLFLLALFTICVNSHAQTDNSSQLQEAKESIAKINLIYFDLYAKNDGSILTLYTQDACLMAPNEPALCGIEALAKDFKDTFEAGRVKSGKFTTIQVYGDGTEYITEEGTFQIFGTNGQQIDDGKYLKLWKKTKEGWKMFRDSFNSNHSRKN